MNNSMLFDSVNFTANTAYNGGGASLFISSINEMHMMLQQINNITFRDCAFVNNSGNGGSALENSKVSNALAEKDTYSRNG